MAVSSTKNSMAMAMAMMIASLAISGYAQKTPACVSKLAPCAPYLNSTRPSKACCGLLRTALDNELPCICSAFKNSDLLKGYNIDLNTIFQLPKHCNITWFSFNTSCAMYLAGAPDASPPAMLPASSKPPPSSAFPLTEPPPATPGSNDNNAAHGTTWYGLSGLMGLFLFWWSVMT